MTVQRAESTSSTSAAPALPDRVLVAIIAGTTKIGVVLDAGAPVSVQLSALVDLITARLDELGQPALSAGGRGRWTLCRMDGTALKPAASLAEQGVVDGTRLWLRFAADTDTRINVVEHVTSAVARELYARWPALTAVWAARVGAGIVVAGVLAASALLGRWRYGHLDAVPATYCGGLAAVLLIAAVIVLVRHTDNAPARGLGDALLCGGSVPAAVGGAAAVPGRVGAPHAALGLAVLVAAAVLVVRFTGRHIALGTAVITIGLAGFVVAVVRMTLVTSAPILLTVLLLVSILAMHLAPTAARLAGGIRLPVFPSASGRWVFETRYLPAARVVASGESVTLDGPESVLNMVVSTDRARAHLTGLLVATATLVMACCVGLCDPHAPRRALPLVLAGLVAVAVLLRGRSFTDRWQATILALAAVAIVIGVAGRYVVGLWTLPALLIGVSVIVAVPVAGLIAAVVVPRRFYTPPLRKGVEWIEYVCLTAIFPLAFWLMGVLAAIRYR